MPMGKMYQAGPPRDLPRLKMRKPTKKTPPPSNKQLAIQIKKLRNQSEIKYHDTYTTASVFNNTGASFYLSNPTQDDGFDQKIGEEITAKYVSVKLHSGLTVGAEDPIYYRAILFWDMACNGVGPSLLASNTDRTKALIDDIDVSNFILAPRNQRTKERYHILMDKHWVVNPQSALTGTSHYLTKNFKLGGAKIRYNGSSANITSCSERGLFLWFICTGNADYSIEETAIRFFYTDQ